MERERAEALRHQQFLAEQQWLAQREAAARAQVFPQRACIVPLRQGIARAGPSGILHAAAELVSGLRVLPDMARDTVVGAMRESLHPQ